MVSKGQFVGLDWNRIARLHSQVLTSTCETHHAVTLRWPNRVFARAFADAIFNTCTRISQTCRQ